MTYDYRDFGASASHHLRNSRASLTDWGFHDQEAALDAVEARFPGIPLWVLGHSLGGSMLPFHKPRQIERAIVLAAGLVRMSDHPWPYQALARQFWYVSGPVATRIAGYLPGTRIGFGSDLPAGVFWQWRRWCTNRNFYLDDAGRRLGQAAAETEARILVTLLEAGSGNGPTLSDGKTLFHADHGNKAGTGAVISDATLSAARLALRTQKGIEDRTIRVTPRNLLVPPALETTAEKWLASIAPATAADVNPFSGSLSLVVEPRLSSATRWYVTADPGEIDGLEFAYLSGAEGPQVESRSGWDVDGVEIRVILVFVAGFIDHRGWFMNAGA